MKGIKTIVEFLHERSKKRFRLRASKVFAEVFMRLEKFGYPVDFEITKAVVENLYNLPTPHNFLDFFKKFAAEDFPQRGQCLFVKSLIELLAFSIPREKEKPSPNEN